MKHGAAAESAPDLSAGAALAGAHVFGYFIRTLINAPAIIY